MCGITDTDVVSLKFDGEVLEDDDTVGETDIENEDLIDVSVSNDPSYHVIQLHLSTHQILNQVANVKRYQKLFSTVHT